MSASKNSLTDGVVPGELDRIIERMRGNGWADLEPAKRSFALAYSATSSVSQASIDSGVSESSCRKYLRDPVVRAMISDIQEEYARVSIINRHFVEQKMLETLEKLEGNVEVPMVTGQGIPITEKKFHSGEVVNLLKEMGKISGIIPERRDSSGGGVQVTINMGALLGEEEGVTIEHNSSG